MVAVGLTDRVPPVVGTACVLPSVPVTVICVAFVAVTVKVEDPPEVIEAGLAMRLTVGAAAVTVTVVELDAVFPPVPVAVAV